MRGSFEGRRQLITENDVNPRGARSNHQADSLRGSDPNRQGIGRLNPHRAARVPSHHANSFVKGTAGILVLGS
jgi:hypothetical protein